MDKYIYDDKNGLWYELQGDYYIPCLTLSEEESKPIGIWGQRHKAYLKEHRKATYTTMLMEGTLNSYLADINEQAQERLETLVEQMKQAEGITEQLKAENALNWVQNMNNIRSCAMEIVNTEIIYR
ncbi:MAG TPA: TnpV protein [Candidatus Faeciplasma pullistercoris]|uniref:TnpV protein n=1 Tax=Candidatus Faeciplasma pullistercoris TaxID=2840800 RepID=A0A9D1KJV9_9FIRM|nr:TnpV protein [Candidatus Faeciplasma pullistercoris]